MGENRPSRLRPAGPILITRVRTPPQIRTASVTVLFADLRGYTGMVERLPAARVVPLLDEFVRVLGGAANGPVFKVVATVSVASVAALSLTVLGQAVLSGLGIV